MPKAIFREDRAAVLLAALVTGSIIAACVSASASADGRALDGAFCGNRCISLAFDGETTTSTTRTDFTLRPGVYWFTVDDPSTVHNFTLREPDGTNQEITTTTGVPGLVTVKDLEKHGSYRLFCSFGTHEAQGMYVDFEVGGVGQGD